MDSRFQILAKQIVEQSLELEKGEKVLIDLWDGANDLGKALIEAVYSVGGIPFLDENSMDLQRALILGATEEGMEAWHRYQMTRMNELDAYVVIRKKINAYEYADIPAERMQIYTKYFGKTHNDIRMFKKKWCLLRYPTPGMAQAAGMSTEAFEDFYFHACNLDYVRMNEASFPLRHLVSRTDKVHIIAPDTDITFSIKGMLEAPSGPPKGAKWNIPGGEVGFPIVPDSANGSIAYTFPSELQGTIFSDVKLTLKEGKIIEATSNHTKRMNEILDTDEHARYIGEFAMGYNPYITRPILDTLFDEKMERTIHFTPGNSKVNPSAIHWDLVTSHGEEYGGGEIWFDGVLIRKDGLFVPDELQGLNPDNLLALLEGKR